jgi:hypothetical protein
MSHETYFIHPNPTKEHMVCTTDGGVLECKHEAAAKRVCELLNELCAQVIVSMEFNPSGAAPPFRGVYLRKHPMGGVQQSYWDGMSWCIGESRTPSANQDFEWCHLDGSSAS